MKAIKSYETLKFGEIRVFVSTLGTTSMIYHGAGKHDRDCYSLLLTATDNSPP